MEPGVITDSGCIVADAAYGTRRVPIDRGVIWIAAGKLKEAERFGWRENGIEAQDGALVQVIR